ncbi:MAG: ATP-binding cassette domain-containing protein, partial [Anaerolineae bacterium]|nr:ATP-binding cassette domain-containing protein [Anaerolineae bacterium]
MAHNGVIVDMRGIVKDFPGVRALDGVDFDLRAGEVHLLVGENGAGKSTLVKILAGVEPLDRGTISINGEKVSVRDPAHAQKLGVGIVYQEMNLVPYLTVAQNIFMRHEPVRAGLVVDVAEENRRAREVLASLNL